MRRFGVMALLTAVLVGGVGLAPAAAAPKPTATPSPSPSRTSAVPRPAPSPIAVAPVGRALVATLDEPVLTLPADDGVRDRSRLRVVSGAGGRVDVLLRRGKHTVAIAEGLRLKRGSTSWRRSVQVPVERLKAGGWRVVVRRDDGDEQTRARLTVGTGRPTTVTVTPVSRTVQPYRDGTLDAVDATVTALDETGAPLPVRGSLRLDAGERHRTRTLQGGRTRIPVTGLPLGAGLLTATVTAAAGDEVQRAASVVLAPTAVGTMRLARSSDTVQPVSDGLLDAVTLTTSGGASGLSPATVSGILTVASPTGVVQSWPVQDGTPRTFEWNGRVGGVILPGTYTATLTLRGPEGPARVSTKPITVSSGHLPYRVRDLFTVADGNQQGLAVHDGIFYVGYDNEDGTSRIERYDENGNRFPLTLSPLAIGHAAELAYSTSTRLLYAVNGGAKNPTTVWALEPQAADGPSALRATYDLSRLGNSGMIAVDDFNGRLLVFSGSAGAYTITPMSLVDVMTTAADGSTTTVPAGSLGASTPIVIQGTPQGLEVVGDRLWVYTSFKNRNRVAKYDLGTAVLDVGSDVDLMNPGEGEGLTSRVGSDGTTWMYVGTHSTNRVSVLEPVIPE